MVASPAECKVGLRFEKVDKRYGTVYALRNLTLTITPGECLALAGRNGSGKTTLLRIAANLTRPTRGSLSFSGITENQNPHAGFVAHATMVYDELTAEENLLFFAKLHGVTRRKERVAELLFEVGLAERKDSLVRTFSRGMRQRVAIARALSIYPPILLADEPTGNLDTRTGEDILALIRDLHSRLRSTVVIVTHDMHVAQSCERMVTLRDGHVVEDVRR